LNDFLKDLNDKQYDAVKHTDGPMLIIAGAGSGKTRVITYKIANIIAKGLAKPFEITAVTFTNKATEEMRKRIEYILEDKMEVCDHNELRGLTVSTFHSYCSRVLRAHIDKIGISNNFVIYDSDDQKALIADLLDRYDMDKKDNNPKDIASFFSSVKNGISFIRPESKLIKIYKDYGEELKKANALDFGDLLIYTAKLFSDCPDVLEIYQDRARYLFVDEYQDTNRIQYKLIKLLSSKHRNICVVGDEDQSIYKWRGADINNILDFEKDYKDSVVVKLEQNYRSTANIIGASASLISNNKQRKHKTLFTRRDDGEKVKIASMVNDLKESDYIVSEIKKEIQKGCDYNDIAVFYRINAQSRLIEDYLRKNGIPYKIVGGIKFYDRKEIKDLIAYLRVLVNMDDSISLLRIINVPGRGIGKTSITKLMSIAEKQKKSLYKLMKDIDSIPELNIGLRKKIKDFVDMMEDLRSMEKEGIKISLILKSIIDRTSYIDFLKTKNTYESDERIDNISEFIGAMAEYEDSEEETSLLSFLESVALTGDADQEAGDEEGVKLMTLHSAKGLEFKIVFIQGVEYGLLPYIRYGSDDVNDIEEERRLMYVGMTRAMKKLYITWARSRRIFGGIKARYSSKFLDELDLKFIDINTDESDFISDKKLSSVSFYDDNSTSHYTADYDNYSQISYEGDSREIIGTRVKHSTYGDGIVKAIEGKGDKAKVTVNFFRHGTKKLIWGYANLTVF
jgi:DNA helicase II / ATP-dependent DNA helicase PcrA